MPTWLMDGDSQHPKKSMLSGGKGYWGCKEDEVPEIKIESDAIEFFKYESASSFFYWDDEKSEFKRIWISD